MSPHRRLPISARHAFALAFELAVRRDPTHSLAVPLLLRLPWILAFPLLPAVDAEADLRTALIWCGVLLGDFLTSLVVMSMLRFRARSTYGRDDHAPAAALECYRLGLARVPWLSVTEIVRTMVLGPSGLFLILRNSFLSIPSLFFLPLGLFLAFRLSLATEAVVLRGGTPVDAFSRSFRLIEGRFERWLEMTAISVAVVLGVWFVAFAGSLLIPAPGTGFWASAGWLMLAALLPVVQYAWTFFYLRLEELDAPIAQTSRRLRVEPPLETAETVAGSSPIRTPQLTLVETRRRGDPDEE